MNRRHPLIWYKEIHKQHSDDNKEIEPQVVERLCTIVGGQPFYRSSGQKSGSPGTFFPFSGIAVKGYASLVVGGVIKPSQYPSDLKDGEFGDYYPEDVVTLITEYLDDESTEFLHRMGNFKMLVISMLIGGGMWNNSAVGLSLEQYMHDNYLDYIEALRKEYGAIINIIKEEADASVENRSGDQLPELHNRFDKENALIDYVSGNFDLGNHHVYSELYCIR